MGSHTLRNLSLIRRALGLSQADLVRRLGPPFTQGYISALERGLRPSDSSHVDRIAQAVNIAPDTLGAESISIVSSSSTTTVSVTVG